MRGGSIRSERLFCEQFEYNLLFRWFLDMDKVSPAFDRSVCSVIRFRAFLTGAAPNLPRLARLPPRLTEAPAGRAAPTAPDIPAGIGLFVAAIILNPFHFGKSRRKVDSSTACSFLKVEKHGCSGHNPAAVRHGFEC